jgi:Fur family peroxide stress response transcriptional regulator
VNQKDQIINRRSKQRDKILELLRSTESHPTADWIYNQLKAEFPKLSLGTVYRNLSILENQCFVKKIHFGSTFDRYEANIKPHYHLICEECGNILDFKMPIYDEINNQAKRQTNFKINRHKLEFFGLCESCNDSN